MRSRARFVTSVLALALGTIQAAGCAAPNVTFKAGATPEAINAAQEACRESNPSEEAYETCMREKGFWVGEVPTGSSRSREGADDSAPDR